DVEQFGRMTLQLARQLVVLKQPGLQQPVSVGHRASPEGGPLGGVQRRNQRLGHAEAPRVLRAAAAAAPAAPAHQSTARVSQALMMSKRRPRLCSKRRSGAGPRARARAAAATGPPATPSNTSPSGSAMFDL